MNGYVQNSTLYCMPGNVQAGGGLAGAPAFWLGCLLSAAVLLSVLLSLRAFERKHSRLQAAAEVAGMDAEALQRLLADVDNIPEFMRQPDVHRVSFINTITAQLWPHVERAAVKLALTDNFLERMVNATSFWRPPFLARSGVSILGLSLGSKPPTVTGIKVFPEELNVAYKSVVLEVDFAWASQMELKMSIRILPDQYSKRFIGRALALLTSATTVTMTVRGMVVKGKARIALRPLLDEIPVAGGVKVSLMGAPSFSYRTRVLGGNPAFIGGLDNWVNGMIKDLVLRPFLWPDGFLLDLAHMAGTTFDPPEGILSVQVVSASNLPRMDLIGKADPYVQLWVSEKQKMSTSIRANTLSPLWNEEFSLLVHDVDAQKLHLSLWDSETLLPDCMMGEVDIPLTALDLSGTARDVWVPVPFTAHKGRGRDRELQSHQDHYHRKPQQGQQQAQQQQQGSGSAASQARRLNSKVGGGSGGGSSFKLKWLGLGKSEEVAEDEGPLSESEQWRRKLERTRHTQQLVHGLLPSGEGSLDKVDKMMQLATRRLHLLTLGSGNEMLVRLRVTYLRLTKQEVQAVVQEATGDSAAASLAASAATSPVRAAAAAVGPPRSLASLQTQDSRLKELLQSGVLHVHIDRAENLVSKKASGFTKNMKVRVSVGDSGRYCKSTERSGMKTLHQRHDPIFETTLEFIIDGATSKQRGAMIVVEIWKEHFVRKPTFKGRAEIPLHDVIRRKLVRGQWDLLGVPSGAIHLELAWTSAAETWQLPPA